MNTTLGMPQELFFEDGIVDDDIFDQSKTKVLFIFNECNTLEYLDENTRSTIESFRRYANGEEADWPQNKMRQKIGEMYKSIDGLDISAQDAVKHISLININKRGGGNQIDELKFKNYIDLYKAFIVKEIELINPDMIVWGSHKTSKYINTLYPTINKDFEPGLIKLPYKKMKLNI